MADAVHLVGPLLREIFTLYTKRVSYSFTAFLPSFLLSLNTSLKEEKKISPSWNSQTFLKDAARFGNVETVKYLLSLRAIEVNACVSTFLFREEGEPYALQHVRSFLLQKELPIAY